MQPSTLHPVPTDADSDPDSDAPRQLVLVETVPAEMVAVCELSARVTAAVRCYISQDQADMLDLGLTEAVTNIVRHGYNGQDGNITIDVGLDNQRLFIEVIDQGSRIPEEVLARDPDAAFDFDPDDLESIPEGGMGIGLIKKTFDAMRYVVADGVNTMHLEVILPNSGS
ncbi:MAG: ATP-binding protein [Burkholderiaceae bacterium]